MIIRALKLIGGRWPAGAVIEVRDHTGRAWIEQGLAEEAPADLGEYATGPAVVYRRPKAKR